MAQAITSSPKSFPPASKAALLPVIISKGQIVCCSLMPDLLDEILVADASHTLGEVMDRLKAVQEHSNVSVLVAVNAPLPKRLRLPRPPAVSH